MYENDIWMKLGLLKTSNLKCYLFFYSKISRLGISQFNFRFKALGETGVFIFINFLVIKMWG